MLLICLLLWTDVISVVALATLALSDAVVAGAGSIVVVAALIGGVAPCSFVGGTVAVVNVHCCSCDDSARNTFLLCVVVELFVFLMCDATHVFKTVLR